MNNNQFFTVIFVSCILLISFNLGFSYNYIVPKDEGMEAWVSDIAYDGDNSELIISFNLTIKNLDDESVPCLFYLYDKKTKLWLLESFIIAGHSHFESFISNEVGYESVHIQIVSNQNEMHLAIK